MRFKDYEDFEEKRPDLAAAIRNNPGNTFVESMKERIQNGEYLTRNMLEGLQKFAPPKVTITQGESFDQIVKLTKVKDKGVNFWCPKLNVNGRVDWPASGVYEELFAEEVRQAIEDGLPSDFGIHLQGKVKWTPSSDPGSFIIVDATWTKPAHPYEDHEGQAERLASIAMGDDEAWPDPAHKSSVRLSPEPTQRSGNATRSKGVLFFGALEYRSGSSDKFWNIAIEVCHKSAGHYGDSFRVLRHYGRRGTRGRKTINPHESYSSAMAEAAEVWAKKLDKGYTPVNNGEGFVGALDEYHSFREHEENEAYFPGWFYDEPSQTVRTDKDSPFGIQAGSQQWPESDSFKPESESKPESEPVIPPEPKTHREKMLPRGLANWKAAFGD